MIEASARVHTQLRALFDAVADEALVNPAFARRLEASLERAARKNGGEFPAPRSLRRPLAAVPRPKEHGDAHPMLHNITFDPLECQIEAALMNGREQEARNFLGRLDRPQLEAVVKAQRLPGAKSLQRKIQEADAAAAVEAIVGSAAERVRSRYSAAG
jgi:hypothetical protein